MRKFFWIHINNLAKKRSFLILILSSCLVFATYKLITSTSQPRILTCFDKQISDNRRLENVLVSSVQPVGGKNIFFHETSCSIDGVVRLNARQACAIESAAAQNPNWQIFVLYANDVGFRNTSPLPLIDAILSYPNINLRYVNITEYTKDTPLEHWILKRKLFNSIYLNSHFSDVLRYLSLFKFGGTYLDMDVIVKENFNNLQPNYAGAESKDFVAAGVLNFDHVGFGHLIADMCLRDLLIHFDGNDWGNNGPGVITRILHKVCETKIPEQMDRARCHSFQVYPIEAFYAIRWPDYRFFFEEKHTNETMAAVQNSIIVHVWNKHSRKMQVKVGTNVAYGLLADQYCPKVYRSSGEYF